MRKFLVTAGFAFVTLAMLAPPVLAQAPAPKVTISGLIDQVTSASSNVQDGSFGRTSDKEWYATTRFRPDIVFEVGRTKRSEEHTSELQSQSNLVCRLLLEKKKRTRSIR